MVPVIKYYCLLLDIPVPPFTFRFNIKIPRMFFHAVSGLASAVDPTASGLEALRFGVLVRQ